ncbi:MAG: DNA-binding protein [Bacteroidetes bacterium GWF2_43_63]|nr:MAG: DNA-binding protein [Bacteroidetes bacterium GWE2_42_42]OFY54373.1 MAG: DNA-binding protein [Bacteroidetes bacterium GWF2_43_63]HBG69237.1 DNA-binding protein [Bacteroidales bacterium]HCB61207.1 DNA-binding protein [Bacteroidales bacterium]HCY24127.1 DNA-binding protein [Bacteroidales bacterium]
MKTETISVFPDEIILNKIFLIRGKKVMIDRDLAEMYDVETKRLKEAVKRNIERFPKDFMFEMNKREFKNWRSQFATSNSDNMGLRYAPCCFTEQGVTMLACILNSKRAIDVNIRIIRVFTRMREMIMTNKDILLKLEQLETQVLRSSDDIQLIFSALKQLLTQPEVPRKKIGFKQSCT